MSGLAARQAKRAGSTLLPMLLALAGGPASSSGASVAVPASVRNFVLEHPALQSLKSEIRWAQPPVMLPVCPQTLQTRWLGQNTPPGKVSLEIACESDRPWRRRLTLEVQVQAQYWVARRSLPAGHRISADDFQIVQNMTTESPQNLAGDPADWAGQELMRALPQGSALKLNNLRSQTVIRKGMEVQIKMMGKGFEIMTSGTAVTDAVRGAAFQVKIRDGKTLQAQAVGEGLAEVRMD